MADYPVLPRGGYFGRYIHTPGYLKRVKAGKKLYDRSVTNVSTKLTYYVYKIK